MYCSVGKRIIFLHLFFHESLDTFSLSSRVIPTQVGKKLGGYSKPVQRPNYVRFFKDSWRDLHKTARKYVSGDVMKLLPAEVLRDRKIRVFVNKIWPAENPQETYR